MIRKKEKAKEYAEENYDSCICKEIAKMAYETGWDEAMKNILVDASKELPEYDDAVWVVNKNGDQFFCHRSNEEIVKTDKYGWCNYSGCDIVAWIRNSTFYDIIAMNKDVLKRFKEK